jgi:hypothetical protein
MRAKHGLALLAGGIVVAAGVVLAVWRPWATPQPPPDARDPKGTVNFKPPEITDPGALLDPARMVTFVCVNQAGGPCKVRVTGHAGNTSADMSAQLAAAPSRAPNLLTSGPFTVEAITVERGGKSRRQALNVTVPGGQTREVRVNADDGVELVRPSE